MDEAAERTWHAEARRELIAPPGFTAWLDDFALDDERASCLQ
jgi:uncharacterized protein (DUF1684 family)